MSKRILALGLLAVAISGAASAEDWTYSGTIANCNAAICNLVPIFDGDPVVGSLTINAGPNATFDLDTDPDGGGGLLDLVDFDFLVGGVIPVTPVICTGDPVVCNGVILQGTGTTGPDGEFTSGVVTGAFVGGTLGGLLGGVNICLAGTCVGAGLDGTDLMGGEMLVTVGGGTVHVADVVANPGFALVVDSDGDGISDATDNCTDVANADQTDTDADGHGNRCDADFNNTCGTVNFLDVLIMRAGFFTPDPLLDLNNSGGPANFGDLAIMQSLFLLPPGPSAPGALCN